MLVIQKDGYYFVTYTVVCRVAKRAQKGICFNAQSRPKWARSNSYQWCQYCFGINAHCLTSKGRHWVLSIMHRLSVYRLRALHGRELYSIRTQWKNLLQRWLCQVGIHSCSFAWARKWVEVVSTVLSLLFPQDFCVFHLSTWAKHCHTNVQCAL